MDGPVVSRLRVALLVGTLAGACFSFAAAEGTANGTRSSGGAPKAASPSASCLGHWAAGTRGRPRHAGAGYRIWRDRRSWHLRTAKGTRGLRFVGRIETARRLRSLRAVGLEKGDSVNRQVRRIVVHFRTVGRDRDGIDFQVKCGWIRFELGTQGETWPARRIYVGANGRAPARSFAAADPAASGVEGRVFIGPNCPVVGVPECPEDDGKPARTTVDVKTATNRFEKPRFVKSVATDDQGRFRVDLPAGAYLLAPRSPRPSLTPKPANARVETGLVTRVDLMLDTGIR